MKGWSQIALILIFSGFLADSIQSKAFLVTVLHASQNIETQALYEGFLTAYQARHPEIKPVYLNIHGFSLARLYEAAQKAAFVSDAFLGPYFSSEVPAVLKASQYRKIPVLALYATDTSLAGLSSSFFSLAFSNQSQAKKIAQIVEKQGIKKISLVYSGDEPYAANLVFWLKVFLFQRPGLHLQIINIQNQKGGAGVFDFLQPLADTSQGVVYVFSDPRYYEALNFYLKHRAFSSSAAFFLPDGLEFYDPHQDFSAFEGHWWFSYYQEKILLPPWALQFYRQKPAAYDLVFLYAGLEILRQARGKQGKTGKTLAEILASGIFSVENQRYSFDGFGFRNLPVSVYQILSGKTLKVRP